MLLKNVIHTWLLVVIASVISLAQVKTLAYKAGQIKNPRVKEAYDTKWPQLKEDLKAIKINPEAYDIYLRAFKFEKVVEVWLKNPGETKYKLFKTYDICASYGVLGPKRMEGDGQIPEGFYRIDLFYPKSEFYLGMKISYPNSSDVILKEGITAGGPIMIQGNCIPDGCLPMTDDKIKELYVLCLEARNRNNPVYFDIFPVKFTPENMKMLEANYPKSKLTFWKTLKPAYDYFEEHGWLHVVNIDNKGRYFYEE